LNLTKFYQKTSPTNHYSPLTTHYSLLTTFHRIDINLEGANPECQAIPSDPLPDYFNYFTASAPSEGVKNVKQYSKVTYKNIYPGIDLEFFTNKEHGYKYNFVIYPGANINDIQLMIEGPESISLIRDTLKFGTRFGDLEELIPESYYIVNDSRVTIRSRFKLINDEVYGFSIDKAIPSNAVLVIDPTPKRLWGTYYGGENNDVVGQCSTDKAGNVFLYGMTNSLVNIASAGSYQGILAGYTDCFLVKFDAAGQRQWGTYFGGNSKDEASNTGGLAIAVDESGNIYFAGCTNSQSGIATPGAHQTIYGGGDYDCFLEKFSQAGYRIWGTYYGGTMDDRAECIATDMNGNVFLAGDTRSTSGIATAGSYQPVLFNTSQDVFLAKFDSNGARQWGTYYGGEMDEWATSCTTDGSGYVYFAGFTISQTNIVSPGAFQTIYGGGAADGYLAKFTTGGQRVWATYYGGESNDGGAGCIVDSTGNVCMVGGTTSVTGIVSPGCHQPVYGGGSMDGYIVKFDSSGQRLWGTYYGGSYYDVVYGCTFGWNGDIFVVGSTGSINNISTPDAYQSTLNGYSDGLLVKLNAAGQRLWASYYGGSKWESFYTCNYVTDDTLYAAGVTTSTDSMASPGAWQQSYGGGLNDCILIKFLDCWPLIAGPISGPDTLCRPSNAVSYSIPPLVHAVNYIWTLPSGFTLTSGAGTANITIDISISAGSGTIWAKGLNKCGDPGDSAYLYITVNPPPVPVISGPDTTCAGTGKVYITAPGNTNYQWSVSAGGVITAGGTTTDNTVTVTWNTVGTQHVWLGYTNANGCEALTPTDYVVQVISSPVVDITISATSNNVCSGTQVPFNSVSANGGVNPFYQWQVNGINAGTNSSSFSYMPLNNDLVRCILTSSITSCIMNNPDTSNVITMVVNPNLPVSVNVSASQNPVCAGTSVIFTATPVNGGTAPTYQWKVNGVNVGANNPVYTYVPTNGDLVWCILTSSEVCTSNNPASSVQHQMIVNDNLPVSVSISASANPVCAGTSVTFTAIPINGGTSPSFQWKVNGINAGTDNPTYSYIPANGDLVSCVLTSNAACTSGNPATSNSITMTVNPLQVVSVTIAASANPVCAGTTVTYMATPTNGGTSPSYQWKVNGVNVGTNNPVYSYTPVNNDVVTCLLTSNVICTSNNPATSNFITMTVNPILPVSVSIAASANPVCAGASVTFTATPTNGGTSPSYQWKVNGVNVGTNNPVYTYVPLNGDFVWCVLTSSESCTSSNPASSIQLLMVVNSNLPAGVSIVASPNPFCPGVTVNYTANPTNGGTSPLYQWKVNGGNQGTNSPNFSFSPQPGDTVWCIMTSNLSCVSGNPATSNKIVMVSSPVPVVTFTRCFDSITTLNAKPIKLKGGIPLGGTYSGPGVNSTTGVFTPSTAGIGTKTITYSYTNVALCNANKTKNIIVQSAPAFTCGNNITDVRDNKVYPTLQLGSQCWMASNLNYGTMISASMHQRDNCIPEKYCYNDLTANCELGTANYQWDELMLYSETPGQQGLCPPGWHVPTEAEWNTLFGNWTNNAFAGAPLKYSGYSGFNALLSGVRHMSVQWDYQDEATFFWSSTPYSAYKAWAHGINDYDPSVAAYPSSRANAFSIRCLKDM